MSVTETSSAPAVAARKLEPNWVWLVGLYVLLMIFIKGVPIGGDTSLYVEHVRDSLQHGWGDSPQVWNFAHLGWRPLGRLLSLIFLPVLLPHFNNNTDMAIAFLFMLPNMIAALVCGLVMQRAIYKLTASRWVSLLIGFAFVCLDPLLNYSRMGSPYCVCLACITLGIYLAAFYESHSWWPSALAGALGGLAAVFWAPCLLTFPSILFARWILGLRGNRKFDFRLAAITCVSGALVVLASYAIGMAAMHIHDAASLNAWIHDSTPDSRDRTALRMINGMGRVFYDMADDSVWLKWYTFHDPFAKVHLWELIRLSVIELGAFYLTLLALAIALWSTAFGKRIFALTLVAMIPNLLLAITYESGGSERYECFLPELFLGVGYILGSNLYSKRVKVLIGVLACLHIPANLATANFRNVSYLVHRDPDRLAVMTSLSPKDRLFVLNMNDNLMRLSYGDPLNPLHLHPLAGILPIVPTLGPQLPVWREIFACAVYNTWHVGGQAWVTKRVLSDQPLRDWRFVEVDSRFVHWNDIRQLFAKFNHNRETGGSDGFFLIENSPENNAILLGVLQGGNEATGCAPYR